MGVFDDKKFEELDWISQATEPIDSKLNEILGAIPETITVDFNLYKEMTYGSYGLDLSIEHAISFFATKYSKLELSWDERQLLKEAFLFESGDEPVILDFENKVLTGELKFVKLISTMDEKKLEGILGKEGIARCAYISGGLEALPRANEVMEILGKCEGGLRSRSLRRKRDAIHTRLIAVFKTNEWKIKDTELANKVGYWISAYVSHGDLAAFSNFCRLKVMTHKDQPIYSMEEVK